MAGDWIKLEHGILDKPEVMELSELLDVSPYQVVGHLVEFWFWCDRNLSPECPCVKGTKRGLDRVAGRDGFGDALIQVGWLTFEDGYFSVPNYDTHLSKSAKQRAKEQRKKAFQRSSVSRSCPDPVPHDQGTKPGPEKRREEKSNTHTLTPAAIDSSPIDLPYWLTAPWERLLEHLFATTGRRVDAIRAETMVMELLRRGEEKALADIEFTILKGGRSILDSANDFEKRAKRPGGGKQKEEPIF
jgi:hypothetical protein